jgi:hypothetical protein
MLSPGPDPSDDAPSLLPHAVIVRIMQNARNNTINLFFIFASM